MAIRSDRTLQVEGGNGPLLFVVLSAANVVFNLTDLATTAAALGGGLQEANSLVLALSSSLGLGLIEALVLLKVAFVSFSMAAAVLGYRSASPTVRKVALTFLLTCAVVFYLVSVNNLLWIAG